MLPRKATSRPLNQQVIRLYQSGQMTEAIALAEKTVAIAKQRLGADNKGG
jgi:hypothetical protein